MIFFLSIIFNVERPIEPVDPRIEIDLVIEKIIRVQLVNQKYTI